MKRQKPDQEEKKTFILMTETVQQLVQVQVKTEPFESRVQSDWVRTRTFRSQAHRPMGAQVAGCSSGPRHPQSLRPSWFL